LDGRGLAALADKPQPSSKLSVSAPDMILQGRSPHSWRHARKQFQELLGLGLDGNPCLTGCVPLVPGIAVATFTGTQITGVCNPNAAAVERQQQQALRHHLRFLSGGGTCFNRAFDRVAALGSLISDQETTLTISEVSCESASWINLVVSVINGAEYVTDVDITTDENHYSQPSSRADASKHAGPYIYYLVPLAQHLPQLHTFSKTDQGKYPVSQDSQIPDRMSLGLPAAAPHLTELLLERNGLVGQLPEDWANWTSIQQLNFDMNDLSGTLADSWGQAACMPRNLGMTFSYNSRLSGTVPASWEYFSSGGIYLYGTSISGCMPRGLDSSTGKNLPLCASLGPAATALLDLKTLLESSGANTSAGLSTWTKGERQAGTADSTFELYEVHQKV
jgi:hypothetical protein